MTPMQKLIEFMKTKRYNTDGVTLCELKAESLLEEERKMVEDAIKSPAAKEYWEGQLAPKSFPPPFEYKLPEPDPLALSPRKT